MTHVRIFYHGLLSAAALRLPAITFHRHSDGSSVVSRWQHCFLTRQGRSLDNLFSGSTACCPQVATSVLSRGLPSQCVPVCGGGTGEEEPNRREKQERRDGDRHAWQ